MGTRSVVAVPLDGGFQGRYVHWDGYPTGVGLALAHLVLRDGLDTVVRTITEDHYGWSNLDPRQPYSGLPTMLGYDDGRFVAVEGYGVAYTEEQGQSAPDQWIRNTGDDWGTEWAYVLNPDHISIFENAVGWTHVADVRYTLDREAFAAVETMIHENADA
jgi:hypothetical protein